MKKYLGITLLIFSICLPIEIQAANIQPYPPAPQAGKAFDIQDTIYGVLRTHRSLRGMQENKQVLEHEVDRAKAGFGPKIDVTAKAGGSYYSDRTTRIEGLDDRMYEVVGITAKLVQPIWDGFATRSRVRSSQSTLDSVTTRVFDTATSLSLDGIIAHIDLLRRRNLVKLAEKNVNQHRAILVQEQDRANLGVDTDADVTQASSRLARAESSLSEAKAALKIAEDTYTRLTGLPAHGKLKPITMPPEVFKNPEAVFEMAQKYNPKVIAYMSDIRTARADKELAESTMYPQFHIEAGPDYTDRGGYKDRWIYSFDVVGTMRWNIFNSGADVHETKAAQARIRQARQVLYNYVDDLKLDTQSTWANYVSAQEQYKHYSTAMDFNIRTREAYLEQFQIGKRSLLDVLDAESELYNSSSQAETARGNILVGAYRLCALTGNLLPWLSINTDPINQAPPVDPADPKEFFAPGWFQ